jgi:ABC-2 type transport system permease protein
MPLWFLSGALFPSESAPFWMRWVMTLNPLSYGLAWLRASLFHGPSMLPSNVSLLFAVFMFAVAYFVASYRKRGIN